MLYLFRINSRNSFLKDSSYTLREKIFMEQIFVVNWSETCKFHRIKFCDPAVNLEFCRIDFHGWCLKRSQKEAIGVKIYKKYRIFAFELLI